MIHHTTLRVQFRDLDSYAHVNHAVYVTWFEIARTDALRDLGIALVGPDAPAARFVVTELDVRYRRPAMAEDVVRIDTSIAELRGASTRWRQLVWRPNEAHDELLVEATVRVGIVGPDGRPMAMPPELRGVLAQLAES